MHPIPIFGPTAEKPPTLAGRPEKSVEAHDVFIEQEKPPTLAEIGVTKVESAPQ